MVLVISCTHRQLLYVYQSLYRISQKTKINYVTLSQFKELIILSVYLNCFSQGHFPISIFGKYSRSSQFGEIEYLIDIMSTICYPTFFRCKFFLDILFCWIQNIQLDTLELLVLTFLDTCEEYLHLQCKTLLKGLFLLQ